MKGIDELKFSRFVSLRISRHRRRKLRTFHVLPYTLHETRGPKFDAVREAAIHAAHVQTQGSPKGSVVTSSEIMHH